MGNLNLFRVLFFTVVFQVTSHSLFSQTCDGTAADAIRWQNGAAWTDNGAIDDSPNAPMPRGIVRCGNSASTQSNIGPNSCYNPTVIEIPLNNYIDPSTGLTVNVDAPYPGQPIAWFQFDVRAFAEFYEFQIVNNSDQIAWALFYSNSPESQVQSNGLAGDPSDLTYQYGGINFNGWADQPFAVPVINETTNYYMVIWDRYDDDFGFNFKARYGCGEPSELLCSIDITNIETMCNSNGTYTATIELEGMNGGFVISDPNAIEGNCSVLCFGDPADPESVNNDTFSLTYLEGVDYAISIVEIDQNMANCPFSENSNDCSINTSGTSPECCELQVVCPVGDNLVFSCFDEIPLADSNSISWTGNCAPVLIAVVENTFGSGCNSNPYYLIRSYIISDGMDTVSCSQTFQVKDTEPPVIICPPTQEITCSEGDSAPLLMATATDNCDNDVEITYEDAVIGSDCGSSFIRTWKAVDNCGNMAFCTQEIYFTDTTPPALLIPVDISIECGSTPGPVFTGNAVASDICSEVTLTYSDGPLSGEACSTSFIRTWVASDACGNSISGEQVISFEDTQGPIISAIGSNAHMQCGELPAAPEGVAFDECMGEFLEVSMTETESGSGCFKLIQRTYTATDNCGNTSSVQKNVTIHDTMGPVIDCPSDVLLSCGDDSSPDFTGLASAQDNCSNENVSITFQDGPLNNQCPRMFQRVWTAIDSCGNVSNCVQKISFDDLEAPTLNCVEDVTINCSTESTDPIHTGTPLAFDDCSYVSLEYTDGEYRGDCPLTFTRTWMARDACNNSTVCFQQITIIDEEAPGLISPADVTVSCGSDYTNPAVTGNAMAFDNCTSLAVNYTDGPITGSCPKEFIRTWAAVDYCGNAVSAIQKITIEDSMKPIVFCPVDTAIDCNSSTQPENTGMATALDYCNSVEISYSDSPLSADCPQYFNRIWRATDLCGNTAECSQRIEFIDNTAAMIVCPADTTMDCLASADPEITGFATAFDNCSSTVITFSDSTITSMGNGNPSECGEFRTQTPGGWGSRANGKNPGLYRDMHFEKAFPDGLILGCDYNLILSNAAAVEEFLPSGGKASVLTSNLLDPVNYGNVLAGHLTAITLSVVFDEYYADFSPSGTLLANQIISGGNFSGWTVSELIAEANAVLGGCSSEYSPSEITSALSAINENYVDGNTDNGFLLCPEAGEDLCNMIYRTWIATDNCGNSDSCMQIITGNSNAINTEIQAAERNSLNAYPSPGMGIVYLEVKEAKIINGDKVIITDLKGSILKSISVENEVDILQFSIEDLNPGIYMIILQGKESYAYTRIIKL